MNPASISCATRVYDSVARCEIVRHWVDHAELAEVSRTLRTLSQSLAAEAKEDYWQQTLAPVSRLSFAFCSTPLPFDRVAEAVCIDWDKLDRQIRLCQQVYPNSHAPLSGLVQKLKDLSEQTWSPFTIPLESLCSKNDKVSVIICPRMHQGPRMHQAVAAYFVNNTRLQNASVISARQLREAHMCNVLVAIGPCKWFPDYVFSAPRAQHVHVVSLRWIRDLWELGPEFFYNSQSTEDKSSKHCIGTLPQIISQLAPPEPSLPSLKPLEPLDFLPPVPSFKKTVLYNAGWQPIPNEETVLAKYCYLSGGRAAFVPADEGSSQLIIDLSTTGGSIVRRVPTKALEPDLFLLLRTAGGGDFIVPLADRILGKLAKERRAQQAEWKNRLLAAAQKRFGTLSRRELSSKISNYLREVVLSINPLVNLHIPPANIHYWMSSKCIRPSKEEYFDIILTFAGLADKTRELWEAMEAIDRAHRRAGHTIRKMLLQQISTVSLEPLERDGEMTFNLGEQDGGTLSAFQIIHISDEEFEIPANLIGVLLDLEE